MEHAEDEKLLPTGEPGIEVSALPILHDEYPIKKSPPPAITPPPSLPGMPSAKAQSWGTLISIIVIVLMIVIGAFYAWGQRIAQNQAPVTPSTSQ